MPPPPAVKKAGEKAKLDAKKQVASIKRALKSRP
jgi:hypothetical protein